MVHSQQYPLFFYGTLRSQEVRHAVLSKLECSLNLVKGFILGYDLFRVKNTNYPLILKNKHSQKRILGFIVYNHNQEIINKLDLFEGENYSRFKAQAFRISDELKVEVELYMPNKKLEYCEPWIFENWLKLEKESFFMKDFNKDGIKKPIY